MDDSQRDDAKSNQGKDAPPDPFVPERLAAAIEEPELLHELIAGRDGFIVPAALKFVHLFQL